MRQGFFVTGTDTGVGKTIVSAWLTLHTQGTYWKPIQTGSRVDPLDQDTVASIIGKDQVIDSHHFFKEPLAPLHAASYENTSLSLSDLILPVRSNPLVIEGAGGVLVPITSTTFITDLIKHFGFPTVVVTRTALGTINHTLLTLEALRMRDLPIAGIVFCGPTEPHAQGAIEQLGGVPILGHLPPLSPITRDHLQGIKPWVNLNTL